MAHQKVFLRLFFRNSFLRREKVELYLANAQPWQVLACSVICASTNFQKCPNPPNLGHKISDGFLIYSRHIFWCSIIRFISANRISKIRNYNLKQIKRNSNWFPRYGWDESEGKNNFAGGWRNDIEILSLKILKSTECLDPRQKIYHWSLYCSHYHVNTGWAVVVWWQRWQKWWRLLCAGCFLSYYIEVGTWH